MSNKVGFFISEIFGPTIQGEGALIGKPTVFVRFGGCDYRCSWCDTKYAVESSYQPLWQKLDSEQIFAAIEKLTQGKPILVTLSGGNPAIYDLSELLALGQAKGYTFAMETQGSIYQDYFKQLDYLTVSPKPPSSGEVADLDVLTKVLAQNPKATLKFVVKDEADYAWAKSLHQQFVAVPCYLQPCNTQAEKQDLDNAQLVSEMLALVERTISDGWFNVTVLPQLHVFLWHNQTGV